MKLSNECRLLLNLIQLDGLMQRQLEGALSFHGLGVTEFRVLLQLHNAAEQKMRRVDLAAAIGLSASGVTRLLNPMEKIGLVRKDASARDARVSLVNLAPAGQRKLEEIEMAVNATATKLFAALEPAQQQQLQALLAAI